MALRGNILFSIVWLLVLIFIAWPLAGFCAGIWIIFQVSSLELALKTRTAQCRVSGMAVAHFCSSVVCSLLKQSSSASNKSIPSWKRYANKSFDLLYPDLLPDPFSFRTTYLHCQLITWPRDLGHAIMNCRESFPSPM